MIDGWIDWIMIYQLVEAKKFQIQNNYNWAGSEIIYFQREFCFEPN